MVEAMKTILIVCVAGFATTSVLKVKTQDGLEERGINNVSIITATVTKISYYIEKVDLIVTALGGLKETDYNVPIVNGGPFLTGRGENVIEEIIKKLNLKHNTPESRKL